ncbi:MAG: hypothetical protein RIQ81_1206, partial [Pseudomonadota bacterium]
MERSRILLSLAASFLFATLACRSGSKGPASEPVVRKGEAAPPPPPESEADSASGPAEPNLMWSPDQRSSQATYHYLLGEMLFQRGDYQSAANLLTSAYSLDPSPFLGARSIVAKAEAGQADEAAREAERLA